MSVARLSLSIYGNKINKNCTGRREIQMAKTKRRTYHKDSLSLKNFDLRKRYDVYYHLPEGLAVCKNVLVKGKKTFEEIGDPRGLFLQYLELEDPKGRTFMLHYLHISMICEVGVKLPFSPIKR
jgi:hypothetical protein